jgi:hypothetical protein
MLCFYGEETGHEGRLRMKAHGMMSGQAATLMFKRSGSSIGREASAFRSKKSRACLRLSRQATCES